MPAASTGSKFDWNEKKKLAATLVLVSGEL